MKTVCLMGNGTLGSVLLLPVLFVLKRAEQRFCNGGHQPLQMPDSSAGMVLGFRMCVCTLRFELHGVFY